MRQRVVGLDGEIDRLVRPLLRLRIRRRQVDRHVDGGERRRHHEDDQQHQHHVDERRDVDVMHFGEFVLAVIETNGHRGCSCVYSAAWASGSLARSRSRLTSRITCAEASPRSAR